MSLSALAQRAFTCFKIIQFIKNVEVPTKENTDQQTFERTQVISLRERLLRERLIKQCLVQKEHYEQVMKVFKLDQGLPLDQIMGKQQSILLALDETNLKQPSTKSLVFFPTHITTNIFKTMIKVEGKQFVFGVAGIGKTISTVLLRHLSDQIIEFRIKEDPQSISNFVDMNEFMKIPKILYLSIEQKTNILDLIEQIRLQAPQTIYFQQQKKKFLSAYGKKMSKQKKKQQALQFLDKLLENMSQLFQKHRISTTVVIDEAQCYYKMTEKLKDVLEANNSPLARELTKEIGMVSSILQLLRKHFPRMGMLTSQKIDQSHLYDLQGLEQYKGPKDDELFRLENFGKAAKCELQPEFRLDSQYYQMEMYQILWFELLRKFKKEGDTLTFEQQRQLGKHFLDYQGFYYTLGAYASYEVWTRQMTHLRMREAVQKMSQDELRQAFTKYFSQYWQQLASKRQLSDKQNKKSQRQSEEIGRISQNVQLEIHQLHKFYTKYLYEEKNSLLKQQKLMLLLNMLGSTHWEFKQVTTHLHCNRFLIIQKTPQTNPSKYVAIALDELVQSGHISIENGKRIANHSPAAFAGGCHFAMKEFIKCYVQPACKGSDLPFGKF